MGRRRRKEKRNVSTSLTIFHGFVQHESSQHIDCARSNFHVIGTADETAAAHPHWKEDKRRQRALHGSSDEICCQSSVSSARARSDRSRSIPLPFESNAFEQMIFKRMHATSAVCIL